MPVAPSLAETSWPARSGFARQERASRIERLRRAVRDEQQQYIVRLRGFRIEADAAVWLGRPTFSPDGNLYVVSFSHGTVYKISRR
jgi:hypothetical protein